MSVAPSLIFVVTSGAKVNVIVSEVENDEDYWLDNPSDPTIAFNGLDADAARAVAFAVNQARKRGTGTRITIRGEATEITPAGASISFRQGGRGRLVSFEDCRELERRLSSAANRTIIGYRPAA